MPKCRTCRGEPAWRLTAETEGYGIVAKGAQRNDYSCPLHVQESTLDFERSLESGYKGLKFGRVKISSFVVSGVSA
jgi:hypothetical protein